MKSDSAAPKNPSLRLAQSLLFLAPAFIFGTWACLLLRLDLSQELVNLQSPRFHPYTMTAAAFLLGLSILFPLFFLPGQVRPLSLFYVLKKLCSVLCLLLPAAAYLILPPAFTTPTALLDRAWATAVNSNTGTASAGRVDPAVVRSFILDSDPKTALSLSPADLLIVQREPELQKVLENRKVEVLGQWMPLPGNSPNAFRLVRLLMVCCAADARPVGVLTDGQAEGAEAGSWFKATGILKFDDPRESVVFKAEAIEPIDAPEEIFLY